ncbi:MAG: hypothetical protein A4E70_02078 [Syntrophus sp. PtaU1.Bin005]|nr:MAG: hypothetical protein A4E70_02078 [Syntrophus sp. PtaU1.Bin005]
MEKALNRLCQLAAEHIAYTATCAKGLYAGFSGTVKQALDMICEIQASQIGFAKPCNTSIYQGTAIATVEDALKLLCNVTAGQIGFAKPCNTSIYQGKTLDTVEDALNLLCDIQAGQISYRPGGSCTFLNQPGIDTVQEALDALCARPAGGGCRMTVGPEGGLFASLEDALEILLEKEERRDICLCLLPGDHEFTGRLIEPKHEGVNLCLTGCGRGTQLYLVKEPAHFRGFASVCLSDMAVVTRESPVGAFLFDRCRDISLKGMAVYGVVADDFLVGVRNARTVTMHGLELEASGSNSLEVPAKLFDLNNALFDLYQVADRTFFDRKAAVVAQVVADLPQQDRRTLAEGISGRVRVMETLSDRERQSYVELVALLRQTSVAPAEMEGVLGKIRLEAVRENPAVALGIADARSDWNIGDCDILGIVTLYGFQTAGPLPADLTKNLEHLVKEGRVSFGGLGTTFRATGCRLTRMDVSTVIQKRLADIIEKQGGTLPALFSSAILGDLTLLREDNQMTFLNTSLSSSVFEVSSARAAVVVGNSTIYVGNRGEGEAAILDITPQGRSERAANLGLIITG